MFAIKKMKKSATDDDLISTTEASKLLGVSIRSVQLWVESGSLPAWRTAGGHRRIARSTIEALLEQRRQAIHQPPTQPAAPRRVLKVVIVDDNPEFLRLFSVVTRKWPFPLEITSASDGFEGLMKIGQTQPDLVITDLNMPGMDGFQMVRSIEKTAPGTATKVIVTSGLSSDEIERRGGLPEGVTFFQKPVPFEQIQELAQALLSEPGSPKA
jgi:excisionase family DNA binding protein